MLAEWSCDFVILEILSPYKWGMRSDCCHPRCSELCCPQWGWGQHGTQSASHPCLSGRFDVTNGSSWGPAYNGWVNVRGRTGTKQNYQRRTGPQSSNFCLLSEAAMERVEEQEQELWWLSAILEQTHREIHNSPAQANLEAASERELPTIPDMTPHTSLTSQSPAPRIQGLHEEMFDILPGTVNTVREPATRVRQMPNIVASNPADDSFEVILTHTDPRDVYY